MTVNDAADPTLEVTTYAMRVYNTDNGWISIVPFYRTSYQLNYSDDMNFVTRDFVSEERINDERTAKCIRKTKKVPWEYNDTYNNRRIRWIELNKSHRIDDTAAFHIMRAEYACNDCGKYAHGHQFKCWSCKEKTNPTPTIPTAS
jgi:hypothetical protein